MALAERQEAPAMIRVFVRFSPRFLEHLSPAHTQGPSSLLQRTILLHPHAHPHAAPCPTRSRPHERTFEFPCTVFHVFTQIIRVFVSLHIYLYACLLLFIVDCLVSPHKYSYRMSRIKFLDGIFSC